MKAGANLLSIIAYARAGALERAKAMFAQAGLERINDDPAVLSIKGRLLKDEALAARGRERKRLYKESARAYARAGAITGASYPLINAATLSLLAGERGQAERLARRILATDVEEAETPYWRAATRAEAQLLVGDTEVAKASLKAAFACAPEAYEDHASTLRQFGLLLDELHENKQWLDAFRPPRCLHFAGHMALGTARAALDREIRKRIAEERIGYGYGALAAGADILIAEALIETGAELHLILPAPAEPFRAASVARFGASWAKRFDAVARRASSIRAVRPDRDPLSPLAIRLAAEVAMGSAVMQAETLMTEAVQLLILDSKWSAHSARSASGAIARAWRESGRRQHVLIMPRLRPHGIAPAPHRAGRMERLAAVLRIDSSRASDADVVKHILPRMAGILGACEALGAPPRWTGEAVIAAFHAPASAARAALSIAAAIGSTARLRIASDYGIACVAHDPFGATPILIGSAVNRTTQIVLSTPDCAIHVTEDFAAALCAGSPEGRPGVEYIGDLAAADAAALTRLFSLRRCPSTRSG